MYLCVKYYLWNLSVFDRGAIIVPGSVRELESHPAGTTTSTVHATLTQSFRSVVGVKPLEMIKESRVGVVLHQEMPENSKGHQLIISITLSYHD